MTEIIDSNLLKKWHACQKGYDFFCDLWPEGTDLQTAIDGLIAHGHAEWGFWLFSKCKENNIFESITLKGYRNSGTSNSGAFNTNALTELFVFNKLCTKKDWDECYKPCFLNFDIVFWIDEKDMTDNEKKINPNYVITGGCIRIIDYKEAFKLSWDKADQKDRIRIKDIPNFDADIFYEISGIDLR